MPEILNLDALFGQNEPITVRWLSREWVLLRPEGMGARELLLLDRLQRRVAEIPDIAGLSEAEQDQAAAALEGLLREQLGLLNAQLAETQPPYAVVVRILDAYTMLIRGREPEAGADDPKAGTGATPSPA